MSPVHVFPFGLLRACAGRPARCLRIRHPDLAPCVPACGARQRGASLVEFSLVAVPILLAGLGCVEIARWFQVRQFVDVALLQAARAGITQHARPQAIEAAFEQALLPLHASGSQAQAAERMGRAFARRSAALGDAPWRIEILGPSKEAFRDYANGQLEISRQTGLAAIDNDYQAEQHLRYQAEGRALGPDSGLSIYQANVLVLRLTYPHEPLLPGVGALLRQLGDARGTYAGRAMALGGYLPIVREIWLGMQSHPVDWPKVPGGKVLAEQAQAAVPAGTAVLPCHGLWCLPAPGASEASGGPAPALPAWPGQPEQASPAAPGSGQGAAGPPASQGPSPQVGPGDPACGVALCCVPD